jgi:hypothetical protein
MLQFRTSGADTVCLSVKCFTLTGDTAQWGVASWADAAAGLLTDRVTGAQRSAETLLLPAADSLLHFTLAVPRTVALVCDTTDSIYALRNIDVVGGLPSLSLKVRFSTTNVNPRYRENGWLMVNCSSRSDE